MGAVITPFITQHLPFLKNLTCRWRQELIVSFFLLSQEREFIHRRKFFSKDVSDGLRNIYFAREKAHYEITEFTEKFTKRLLDKTEKIYKDMLEVYEREQKYNKRTQRGHHGISP